MKRTGLQYFWSLEMSPLNYSVLPREREIKVRFQTPRPARREPPLPARHQAADPQVNSSPRRIEVR